MKKNTNNCNVAGTSSQLTNYMGGDWAGVTQQINANYFNDLGVNTLWITVPIKNADDIAGLGTNGDTHMYSSYHGYWPSDPTKTEDCFGTAAELKALVDAAHDLRNRPGLHGVAGVFALGRKCEQKILADL